MHLAMFQHESKSIPDYGRIVAIGRESCESLHRIEYCDRYILRCYVERPADDDTFALTPDDVLLLLIVDADDPAAVARATRIACEVRCRDHTCIAVTVSSGPDGSGLQGLTSEAGAIIPLAQHDLAADVVVALARMLVEPSIIGVDYADIRTLVETAGGTFGAAAVARGAGEHAAHDAVTAAMVCFEQSGIALASASGVIMIFGALRGATALAQISAAANVVQAGIHADSPLVYGVVFEPPASQELSVTLVALGVKRCQQEVHAA